MSGQVLVYPPHNGRGLRIAGPALVDLLRKWIADERASVLTATFERGPEGDEVLSSEALRAQQIEARFDEAALELKVAVLPEARRTNQVFLSGRGMPPSVSGALSPSPLSAFVNTRVGQDFAFSQASGENGRRPLRTDFESAVNFRDWVLEGTASYTQRAEHELSRGDVRLVRDFPEKMIRVMAGDLSYPLAAFQQFRPLGGLTVASNFTLQPYRVTIPMSTTELYLKSPSRVVVYVNGFQAQMLYLPAGRHDLRNLALGNGVNFIRLEITDDVGRVETLTFPWVSESDLLARGLHQFAYTVGAASTNVDNRREYARRDLTGSMYHRYGLSNRFTVGVAAQADDKQKIGSLEWLFANRFGTIGLEPAFSHIEGRRARAAWRLRYNYTDYNGPQLSQRNFTLGLQYLNPEFAQLGELNPSLTTLYDLSASYSQSIFWNVAARLSGTYQFNRNKLPGIVDSYSGTLSFVRVFDVGIQTSASLTRRVSQANIVENSAFLLFSWVIPGTNHFLNASQDTGRHASRMEWRYNSPQLVGGYNAGLSYERTPQNHRVDALAEHIGNRGNLSAAHNMLAETGGGRTSQLTSLRGGFSLAFAGGKLGVGRPITDSFAIVAASDALSGQTIGINPNSAEFHEARADWLGPAVVPNIRSYQYYNLYLDPSRLEPGRELGHENYTLLPSYRSGLLVRAGGDSRVMLAGVIVDGAGKPVALETAEARRIGAEALEEPVLLFTNRKGKFRMEGFKPGEYELVFYNESLGKLKVSIPENASGIHDAGRLTVRPVK